MRDKNEKSKRASKAWKRCFSRKKDYPSRWHSSAKI
jgi:hypothetical protein